MRLLLDFNLTFSVLYYSIRSNGISEDICLQNSARYLKGVSLRNSVRKVKK